VNAIVAAASDAVRRELADLVQSGHFGVDAIAEDSATLAALLQRSRGAVVVTGGTLARTRPFLEAARAADTPVIALLSGRADSEDRSSLGYGGLAVLKGAPHREAFRAAVTATRAGLSVWDPQLDAHPDIAEPLRTPLSPRERSILELAGAGLSTKQVARRLGISPNTVKFHLQAAFDKLGVTSRAEAVMTAIRRGELSV
jgi:DNA-binding NarL/FixJ family response regulator